VVVAGSTVDSYDTGDDGAGQSNYGVNWEGQMFYPFYPYATTPLAPYPFLCTGAKLRLYKVGAPTDITLSIRVSDGSGSDLASDIIASSAGITTDTAGDWVEFTWDTPIPWELYGVAYSLILRCTGDASNYIKWRVDTSSPTYCSTGAYRIYSTNSGVGWSSTTSYDMMFRLLGEAPGQMKIGGCEVYFPTFDATYAYMVVRRLFNNVSGAGIDIDEMGIQCPLSQYSLPVMLIRDCFPGSPVTVANNGWLLAQYTFKTSIVGV
jgi:hypothetical protein